MAKNKKPLIHLPENFDRDDLMQKEPPWWKEYAPLFGIGGFLFAIGAMILAQLFVLNQFKGTMEEFKTETKDQVKDIRNDIKSMQDKLSKIKISDEVLNHEITKSNRK